MLRNLYLSRHTLSNVLERDWEHRTLWIKQANPAVDCQARLKNEIPRFRQEWRRRMAFSRDWSDLEAYVKDSFTLARCRVLFDLARVLIVLRLPGASYVERCAERVMLRTRYFCSA